MADSGNAKVDVTVLNLAGETVATLSVGRDLAMLELKKQLDLLGDPCLISLNWEGKVLQDRDTASTLAWPGAVTVYMVMTTFDHESPIVALRDSDWKKHARFDLDEVRRMCSEMKELFLNEPSLLELHAPLVISAHFTGSLDALNYVFNTCGEPGPTSHLFLGNYVSRGRNGLEVLTLLLCYKKKFPAQVHLLRGKQECASIARIYGFYDECKQRFSPSGNAVKLFRQFVEVFNSLPLAAVVQSRIFCVSSGLSPELQSVEEIRNVQRPVEVGSEGLVCDLLWSDPEEDPGWHEMDKGVSFIYGPDIVEKFLEKNHMELLVRGSQVVENGHEHFAAGKGVTIFSSPDYMGEFNNRASVMLLDEDLQYRFHSFDATMAPCVESTATA